MDVSIPQPEFVVIEDPSGICRNQTVEYEWRLEYCQECCPIGTRIGTVPGVIRKEEIQESEMHTDAEVVINENDEEIVENPELVKLKDKRSSTMIEHSRKGDSQHTFSEHITKIEQMLR
ncbi:hypothetical protein HAX54_015384 [Datura stramonium]|uniref:Uncharacterized protein n=1 Tax=Datura stramonium TaxID=4076 RepID=A0ABS8TQL2_DATST|nr:hypothetical protein [Datura stramonium]